MSLLSNWRPGLVAAVLAFGLSACARSPEELYERALESAKAGDPGSAVVDLKNALQERPNYGAARRLLGEQYLRMGDSASAIKELQRALEQGEAEHELLPLILRAEIDNGNSAAVLERLNKLNADDLNAPLWTLRGDALVESNDADAAVDAYRNALRLDPKSADAHLGLARVAWSRNDAATAEREFALSLQLGPKSARAWLTKGDFALSRRQFPTAVEAFTAASKNGQGFDRVRAKIGLARTYIFSGDKENAQVNVDLVLKQAPDLPMGHYLAALLAHQKGEYARAEEQLAMVLARAPDHVPSIFLKGVVNAAQEKWLVAEEALARVVALVPNDLQSRKLLATVYLRQDQVEKALNVLEGAQSLGVDDPQFQAMLGGAYMRADQTEKGMVALERAAELAPTQPEFRTQVALGNLAIGDSALATEQLRAAANQSAEDMRSDMLLVMVLLREKKFDEALAEGQRLVRENPKDPVRYNLVAAAWIGKGNDAEAEKVLRQALTINPKFGPAKLNLALLAQKRNDVDGAYRLFQEAFADDKTNYRALAAIVQIEMARNRTQQALAILERVRIDQPKALEPRSMLLSLYSQLRDYNAALGIAREALNIQPRNPAVRLAHGRVLLSLQRYGEAVQAIESLARDSAYTGVDMLYELARARLATRNLPEARRVIDLALQQSQRKHAPSIQLAIAIALQDKRVADARALFGEFQQVRGDGAETQELSGDLAMAENRPADAVAPYRAALRAAPSTTMVGKLSSALVQSGKPAEAVTELQAWIRQYPRDTGARLQLADVYLGAGQMTQAQATYEAVLQASPENPFALNNLAWIYLQRGDRRAGVLADKALRLLPDNPEIMDTAAWIRFKSGSKDGVLSMLRKAAERSPNPEIRYHIAEVLASEGDRAGARRELDRILAPGAPAFASRADAQRLRQRM